jgi:hypothetical protein
MICAVCNNDVDTKKVCTCKALGPGSECVACEVWKCRKCLKVYGWLESGKEDGDGVCDACWAKDEEV